MGQGFNPGHSAYELEAVTTRPSNPSKKLFESLDKAANWKAFVQKFGILCYRNILNCLLRLCETVFHMFIKFYTKTTFSSSYNLELLIKIWNQFWRDFLFNLLTSIQLFDSSFQYKICLRVIQQIGPLQTSNWFLLGEMWISAQFGLRISLGIADGWYLVIKPLIVSVWTKTALRTITYRSNSAF